MKQRKLKERQESISLDYMYYIVRKVLREILLRPINIILLPIICLAIFSIWLIEDEDIEPYIICIWWKL